MQVVLNDWLGVSYDRKFSKEGGMEKRFLYCCSSNLVFVWKQYRRVFSYKTVRWRVVKTSRNLQV